MSTPTTLVFTKPPATSKPVQLLFVPVSTAPAPVVSPLLASFFLVM